MTEPAAVEDRGSLTVAPRVLSRIAEAASLEVHGTARADRSVGGDLPHARTDLEGSTARVQLDVAVWWGQPLAAVAAQVRAAVARGVGELSGMTAARVDVHVRQVLTRPAEAPRRVQ